MSVCVQGQQALIRSDIYFQPHLLPPLHTVADIRELLQAPATRYCTFFGLPDQGAIEEKKRHIARHIGCFVTL